MDGTITISSSSSSATAPAEKKAFREETLNQITHGIGLALSLAGAVVLVETAVSNGSFARIVGCCVYAASLVALYAASTLSHSFDNLERRNHWRMLDQVCIFLFIAGGFTPFVLVHMRENWGWALLGLIWAGALWGARARFRTGGESIAPKYFIALAWVPIVAMAQIMHIGHELGQAWSWAVPLPTCWALCSWSTTDAAHTSMRSGISW